MVFLSFVLFLLLFIVVFNYSVSPNVLYPPFLFSSIWLADLLLYFFRRLTNFISIDMISMGTLLYLLIAVILYSSFGYFLQKFTEKRFFKLIGPPVLSIRSIRLIFLLCLILLPFMLYSGYHYAVNNLIMDNYLATLKNSHSIDKKEEQGILKYGLVIAIVMFHNVYYNFLNFDKRSVLFFILACIIISINILLTGGRTYLLLIVSIYLSLKINSRALKMEFFRIVLFFLIIFVVIGVLLGKIGDTNSGSIGSGIVLEGIEAAVVYFVGGLVAFDKFLMSNIEYSFGTETFRSIVIILNKIGISDFKEVTLVQPYVNIPFEFNVYTIYYHYVKDFGIIFSLLFVSFISLVSVYVYNMARVKKSRFSLLLFAIIIYANIMSVFQENFVTLLPFYFYLIIIQLLMFNKFKVKQYGQYSD
jgi:oligosaccharide repeat unit polymerase